MAVVLEGGCRVTGMREGAALESGTLRVWPQIGRNNGAQAISLRVLEFAPGLSPGMRNETCDEILYVLRSAAERATDSVNEAAQRPAVFINGRPYEVGSATGIYLRPGQTLTVDN